MIQVVNTEERERVKKLGEYLLSVVFGGKL